MFGKLFVYNNFWQLEQFLLFIKYISAFCSWLSLSLSVWKKILGILPNNNTASYLCYKSQRCHHRQLPSFVGAVFKKQITALFSTVNHTLHCFTVTDNSKAECVSHIQMENIGFGASCCEILNHWLTALTTRKKLRNIKRGKDSKWRKTKEGEVQKATGHNVLCTIQALVLLNTS